MIENDEIFGTPSIHEEAFVSSKASVVGDVRVKERVIIAPGASIRADEEGPFLIGKGTNIQDGVIFHGLLRKHVEVGRDSYSIWTGSHCSAAHGSKVHGPTIVGKKTFIGFDSIVHASVVGRNCFIGFQSLVKNATIGSGCYIGDQALVKGVIVSSGRYVADGEKINTQEAADNLPSIPPEKEAERQEFNREVVDLNKQLVELYKARRRTRQKTFRWLLGEIFGLISDWLQRRYQ